MKTRHYYICLITCITVLYSCKKMVNVDLPKNQLNTAEVFADTTATKAALLNIYALIDKTVDNNLNKYLGVFTDDLSYPNQPNDEFLTSNLSPVNSTVLNFWRNSYFAIYSCNDIIQHLGPDNPLPEKFKANILAEAKFLRAYFYFYLVSTFGKVPLITGTNVDENRVAARNEISEIYFLIQKDLQDALNALTGNTNSVKTRANKYAAMALAARVYLTQENWDKAKEYSATLISSNLFSPLPAVASAFGNNSKETVFHIWTPTGFIADATTLFPASGRPLYPLTPSLLNSFEQGDLRKASWIRNVVVSNMTYSHPYKYRNRTANISSPEYLIVFRLSEQYLIHAEATAALGSVPLAVRDVNIIRNRAGLPSLTEGITVEEFNSAIRREWRNEFFAEGGQRFLQLKRSGKLKEVVSNVKPAWPDKSALYPIPQNEIITNPNLEQNSGY